MGNNAVLIRGLDRNLYNKIVAKAREEGRNVADIMNEAMHRYVGDNPGHQQHDPYENKMMRFAGTVVLSKQDILGLHDELGAFHLENSGELTFDKDVDREALHKIERIHNIGKLRVPAGVHHHVLLKAGQVRGEIAKY